MRRHSPDCLRSNGTATHTTQCRSRPVSGSGLPKTGIFHMRAGDYGRFRPKIVQIWSLETAHQSAKARNWRAFLRYTRVQSPVDGLPGWGGRIRTSEWENQNPLPELILSKPWGFFRDAAQSGSKRLIRQATFCSELTGFPAQTERCCGGLERLRRASGICPAGYLPGRG
jgi:hypothetical protein